MIQQIGIYPSPRLCFSAGCLVTSLLFGDKKILLSGQAGWTQF